MRANAKTFKPWTGRFFGWLFLGAMERKTGLSKWPILSPNRCRSIPPVCAYDPKLREKPEPGSIFNLAERMVGEKMAPLDHLRLNLILKTRWKRVGSFRSVLGSTSLPCLVRWP
jgi:hypothetical protein